MAVMDARIRAHGGSKATPRDPVIATCLEEIAACNKLLVGEDLVHVVTSDNPEKLRKLRPFNKPLTT
jgi:hypothetical protein